MGRLSRIRTVLTAELAAVRRSDPDLEAGHVTAFGLPLAGRLLLLGLVGVIPLLAISPPA